MCAHITPPYTWILLYLDIQHINLQCPYTTLMHPTHSRAYRTSGFETASGPGKDQTKTQSTPSLLEILFHCLPSRGQRRLPTRPRPPPAPSASADRLPPPKGKHNNIWFLFELFVTTHPPPATLTPPWGARSLGPRSGPAAGRRLLLGLRGHRGGSRSASLLSPSLSRGASTCEAGAACARPVDETVLT